MLINPHTSSSAILNIPDFVSNHEDARRECGNLFVVIGPHVLHRSILTAFDNIAGESYPVVLVLLPSASHSDYRWIWKRREKTVNNWILKVHGWILGFVLSLSHLASHRLWQSWTHRRKCFWRSIRMLRCRPQTSTWSCSQAWVVHCHFWVKIWQPITLATSG